MQKDGFSLDRRALLKRAASLGATAGLAHLFGPAAFAADLPPACAAPSAGRPAPAKAVAETGIVLGRRFGFLTVVATRPGSPARRAGVKAGDFIKTIDGRHTHNITVFRGERMLEGAPDQAQ